jgi:hypothetical protein
MKSKKRNREEVGGEKSYPDEGTLHQCLYLSLSGWVSEYQTVSPVTILSACLHGLLLGDNY